MLLVVARLRKKDGDLLVCATVLPTATPLGNAVERGVACFNQCLNKCTNALSYFSPFPPVKLVILDFKYPPISFSFNNSFLSPSLWLGLAVAEPVVDERKAEEGMREPDRRVY